MRFIIKKVKQRKKHPPWPNDTFHLVSVGTLAKWHGWDKVVNAMRLISQDTKKPFNVFYHIIGDGPSFVELENLINKFNLKTSIKLYGFLPPPKVEKLYEMHLGIGSLGWSRVGISLASQ